MQVEEIGDVWVKEPRWSWYGSPLWRCHAVQVNIRMFVNRDFIMQTGAMTTADFKTHIANYNIYFTPEEYVMFKMANYAENKAYDMQVLRQGIIYS